MHIDSIPDEIIGEVLYYVPGRDVLSGVQLTCRRFARLCRFTLLWRYKCIHDFKYWHSGHDFEGKLRLPPAHIEWRDLYLFRLNRNHHARQLLDGIIASRKNRPQKFGQIGEFEYDAREFLLEQCNVDDSVEDALARRYYAEAVLQSLHRGIAIGCWMAARNNPSLPGVSDFERILGAFDMFFLSKDAEGDIPDIYRIVDAKTAAFTATVPNLRTLSTRAKVLALNLWLRQNRLTGLVNANTFRNLRNCLIGQALRHEDHDSIPLISCAIYCCIARRLRIDAHCCAFPGHVHVVVRAPIGETLDGVRIPIAQQQDERMWIDPFGSDDEVQAAHLQTVLNMLHWTVPEEQAFGPADPRAITLRTALNMRETLRVVRPLNLARSTDILRTLHGSGETNADWCISASQWALVMLTPPTRNEWMTYISDFLYSSVNPESFDSWLINKYFKIIYESSGEARERFEERYPNGPNGEGPAPFQYLGQMLSDIELPVYPRDDEFLRENIKYKVGQVFWHRRYGTIGAIVGWSEDGPTGLENPAAEIEIVDEFSSDEDEADEFYGANYVLPQTTEQVEAEEIARRQFLDAKRARKCIFSANPRKIFYKYILPDSTKPLIASASSIKIIKDPADLDGVVFDQAGKWFKRFDRATCRFVSNVREEFPDD